MSIFATVKINQWDVWRPLPLTWIFALQKSQWLGRLVKTASRWQGQNPHLRAFRLHAFHFLPQQKKREKKITQRGSCGAQCHWEVEAEQIRKGQERGSQLQGNKGKPIPSGIILTLETRDPGNSGSMSFSAWGGRGRRGGEKEEEGGVRAGYCSEKSVPCCV